MKNVTFLDSKSKFSVQKNKLINYRFAKFSFTIGKNDFPFSFEKINIRYRKYIRITIN